MNWELNCSDMNVDFAFEELQRLWRHCQPLHCPELPFVPHLSTIKTDEQRKTLSHGHAVYSMSNPFKRQYKTEKWLDDALYLFQRF